MFALKRALKFNKNEATLMVKHAGFRRVVFNMGLKPSDSDVRRG